MNPTLAQKLLPRFTLHLGDKTAPPPANAVVPSAAASADSMLAQQKPLTELVPDEIFSAGGTTGSKAAKNRHAAPKHVPEAKPAAPAPAPKAPVAAQPEEPGPSLIDKLKVRYHTSDIMAIFSQEVEAGHFTNALTVYKLLAPAQADSKKAKLYLLRSFKGVGDNDAVKNFVTANNINDGEFYLEKARWYYVAKDYGQAYEVLKRASVLPAAYMEGSAFRELLLYSKATCASALYDKKPNSDTKKEAMEAWFDVKSQLKMSPEHKYFVKADAEIRRISTNVATK
jgi:hypothetical protein